MEVQDVINLCVAGLIDREEARKLITLRPDDAAIQSKEFSLESFFSEKSAPRPSEPSKENPVRPSSKEDYFKIGDKINSPHGLVKPRSWTEAVDEITKALVPDEATLREVSNHAAMQTQYGTKRIRLTHAPDCHKAKHTLKYFPRWSVQQG